jgi:hypothetical protein
VSTFALDSFHPDVLRCLDCGQAVANVADLGQADEPLQEMTARQALRCWPGATLELVRHDVTCTWQRRDEAEGLTGEQRLPRTA